MHLYSGGSGFKSSDTCSHTFQFQSNACRKQEMYIQFWSEDRKRMHHFRDLDIIIVKWVFLNYASRCVVVLRMNVYCWTLWFSYHSKIDLKYEVKLWVRLVWLRKGCVLSTRQWIFIFHKMFARSGERLPTLSFPTMELCVLFLPPTWRRR